MTAFFLPGFDTLRTMLASSSGYAPGDFVGVGYLGDDFGPDGSWSVRPYNACAPRQSLWQSVRQPDRTTGAHEALFPGRRVAVVGHSLSGAMAHRLAAGGTDTPPALAALAAEARTSPTLSRSGGDLALSPAERRAVAPSPGSTS